MIGWWNLRRQTNPTPPTQIGIFYGSSTCYTEIAAERIQELLSHRATLHNIAHTALHRCAAYRTLLFGIPTWDYGELQEDWDSRWDELDALELTATDCAIFGLGDQHGYPLWFQDAMGYLHHRLAAQGAKLGGYWPNQGYEFQASKALTADGKQFLGLPLDYENQAELSDQRLRKWLTQLGLLEGAKANTGGAP